MVKRISFAPIAEITRKRLMKQTPLAMESAAVKSWEIEPESTTIPQPAYFLPDQLSRIISTPFSQEDPKRVMLGNYESHHSATKGFLLENALLIDGVLYKGKACSHLHPRLSRPLKLVVENEIDRAAVFCTPGGNRYFGQWLMDDCVTYELAAAEGEPVTTNQQKWLHTVGYENWLEMKPMRMESTLFRELVLFEDVGQNRSKHLRRLSMTKKLLAQVKVEVHPGVFILRGDEGERRMLVNELEVAERLRDRRGFRVIDPMKEDVPTIISTCAGAKTVVGIEGSQLMHGIQLLGQGGNILVLQPPNRFVWVYKDLADRDGQNFGFVVGYVRDEDFYVDPEEVERTLDLFPSTTAK